MGGGHSWQMTWPEQRQGGRTCRAHPENDENSGEAIAWVRRCVVVRDEAGDFECQTEVFRLDPGDRHEP